MRLEAWIDGRVQGVWYRASTLREAERLGLTGWVRNCIDGRVELCAEGDRPSLEALLAWCRRGPEHAEVERIELTWSKASGHFTAFHIR